MNIILIKSVPKLGLPGDVKEVKDGYARNYLIPQGLALVASDPAVSSLKAELKAKRAGAAAEQEQLEATAKDWEGKAVTIARKATADGTLFAAVTKKDVAAELGVPVKQVRFASVKRTGDYQAELSIAEGMQALVPVTISAGK